LCTVIFLSCAGENNAIIPVPPRDYFIQEKKIIELDSIIETKDGSSAENLPVWLKAYISGGIEEIEKITAYNGKYVFIGINEGINFAALKIWADNFSTVKDFSMLSAQRIQKRMISTALHYPDDEYGVFFETMVKSAYSTVYPDVIKEDIYWIKLKDNNDINNGETYFDPLGNNGSSEINIFFIFLITDKTSMQTVISVMLEEVSLSVNPVGSQRNSINRLRLTFFEGF
jgi:hypothetical protein